MCNFFSTESAIYYVADSGKVYLVTAAYGAVAPREVAALPSGATPLALDPMDQDYWRQRVVELNDNGAQ